MQPQRDGAVAHVGAGPLAGGRRSPLQSRMSSNTWKARPMRRPYSPTAPTASSAPESRAPSEHAAEKRSGFGVQRRT